MNNTKFNFMDGDKGMYDRYIAEFVRLYQDAYGNDAVRKEGMFDPKTGKTYSFQQYERMKERGENVGTFKECYPSEEVITILKDIMQKKNSISLALEQLEDNPPLCFGLRETNAIRDIDCKLQIDALKKNKDDPEYTPKMRELLYQRMNLENQYPRGTGKFYGVACGYDDTLEQLNTEKLKLSESDFASLVNKLQLSKDSTVNYLAEVFVQTNKQGRGIGRDLIGKYTSSQLGAILTRTTQLKDNPYKTFEKMGFRKVYDYPEGDQRKRGLWFRDAT